MLASISSNSYKQYSVYIKKWCSYCNENNLPIFESPTSTVIDFLTSLYNSGSQYGSLNSCRAALALVLGPNLSEDHIIKRFLKGVFRLRPPAPKYDMTWDTNSVLDYLSTWYPNEDISIDLLSKKCVTLLALITAHRVQTLSKINLKNIEILPSKILIKIPDLIKTSRIGTNQPLLHIPYFLEKPQICPGKTLQSYISRTAKLRKSKILFISFKKPHRVVTSQTLSRWIKCTLEASGIDVSVFGAHSTRHAATSRALANGTTVDQIRKAAGWSANSTTFAKFYNRTILSTDETALARSILTNT